MTALRFTVGASLRAQVDLYKILTFEQGGTGAGEQINPTVGYLSTPLIVTSQQTVKVQQRVVTASTTHQIIFHGFVAEIQGKTLEA